MLVAVESVAVGMHLVHLAEKKPAEKSPTYQPLGGGPGGVHSGRSTYYQLTQAVYLREPGPPNSYTAWLETEEVLEGHAFPRRGQDDLGLILYRSQRNYTCVVCSCPS